MSRKTMMKPKKTKPNARRWNFGRNPWRNCLIQGDASVVATALGSELAGRVDLVYLDPPFATGNRFDFVARENGEAKNKKNVDLGPVAGQRVLAYRDHWGRGLDRYLTMMATCLGAIRPLLADTGSIIVHVDYRVSAHMRLLLDEIFGVACFRNEIIWHYQSGGVARNFYPRKHDNLFWYGKTETGFFNPDAASRPRSLCGACGQTIGRRNNMKKHVDEQGRVCRTIRSAGKVYRYYDDHPVLAPDVWQGINHLQQRDPERTGYPTQKPLSLLDRIVRAHCPPGGLVADFFCGSGTTLVAAHAAGMRWLGCDTSPIAIKVTGQRLKRRPASGKTGDVGEGENEFESWTEDSIVSPAVRPLRG